MTRFSPSPLTFIVVKSATTSGVIYSCGSPISYKSCSLTDWTFMRPPVFSCFVMTKSPFGEASTIGKPMFARSGMLCQSNWQLPPEHCPPHSMMCPAIVPVATLSQSLNCQPNSCISGASVKPVSVSRPPTMICAPLSNASTSGFAPR